MTIRSRAPVNIFTPLRLESEPGQIDGRTIRVEEGSRNVFLTFDDGPNSFCAPQVLDVLAEHRVVATFCVIGDYLRAPYGAWTSEARASAALFGLEPLNWSVDPRDWSRRGVDVTAETVLTRIRPGGVILLHDGCPADDLPSGSHTGLREQTVMVLRRLIPALHDRGFVFQSLPVPSIHSPVGEPV
ncbi:polysaccharide deacetylase family protein [Parafrankia soli]|uniref:polysaccharide deacetylase family protein n=1 Tax=Parafrankia soli TaxID=2599596 RepID=UPI003B84B0A0